MTSKTNEIQTQVTKVVEHAGRSTQLAERGYVRELAGLVKAASEEERMKRVMQRWRDVNELRRPDRAPVWCKPVGCWEELLSDEDLHCKDATHRRLEKTFRQTLIKHDIGDDEIISGLWDVSPVIKVTPGNRWGVEVGRHGSNEKGGAWKYDPPLKSPADFDKLTAPEFYYDAAATEARYVRMREILGDAMPVRCKIAPGFDSATIVCTAYAQLRGLENLMLDTVLEPEFAHQLCRFITDSQLRFLDTLEKAGMNATNCDIPMLCSDPFGPPPAENGRYTLANCWCAGNSQEFDQVSPAGFREFLLQYQEEIFRRFGRVSYGCCENLTHKMDMIIEDVPNLRLLTCSAWTDFDRLVNTVEDQYAIMWRQKATDVVFTESVNALKPSMMEKCQKLQGRYYQIVLRELQTLNGDLRRLHDWTKLAIECAEK